MSLTTEASAERRIVHLVAVVFVLALLLWNLRLVLNPFVLFVLLVTLLWPQRGTRHFLLLVGPFAVLLVFWLLRTTGSLFAPFILAWVLAYILRPLASALERRRVPGGLAVGIAAFPVVAALVFAVLVAIPAIRTETEQLVRNAPALVERVRAEILRRDLPFVDEAQLVRALDPDQIARTLQAQQQVILERGWRAVRGVGKGIGTLFTLFGFLVLTPILAFYLIRDYETINRRIALNIPAPYRERTVAFVRRYDALLARYLRGQVLVAGIVGAIIGIGLTVAGFPYGWLVGLLGGIFNVVPYMGFVVTVVVGALVALFSPAVQLNLIKLAVVLAIEQVLENAIIQPRIVGGSVGMHPVWIILALAVAGYFFGFVGLLLAVPAAVLVKLVLASVLGRYRQSRLYLGTDVPVGEPQ